MITWDEPKRTTNLKKHGINLADLESAFDFPMVTVEDDREVYGELRLQSLAMWRGRVYLSGVDRAARRRSSNFVPLCRPLTNPRLF